jgi:peptidoglycan/LPS O-acetylase OafA/YrhL
MSRSVTSRVRDADPTALTHSARLHWIDWLRVLAIAGVFVYHTLRPFNTDDWHVKNAETSVVLNGLTTFFGAFGLAVLFLIAGAGVRFALRRRTWSMFVRERTLRLLVPFAVGTLLLSPFQGFIEATQKGTTPNPATDLVGWWSTAIGWASDRGISPTAFGIGYHLWFLGFLFAMSLIALPLCEWLIGDRGRAATSALAAAFSRRGASLAVVIPIFALMGIGSALGTEENDWFAFTWYFGYFMIGFLLVSDERFPAAVRRDLWPAATVAVVVTVLIVAGIPAPLDTAGDHGMGIVDLTLGALFAALGWSCTLVILNAGMRAAGLQRPVNEHLGEAVLPVYVIHQPVILAVAFFVVQWPLAILPKWLVVLGISLPITLLLVEVALRMPVTRLLLGARLRPAPPTAPAPAPGGARKAPRIPSPERAQHARSH